MCPHEIFIRKDVVVDRTSLFSNRLRMHEGAVHTEMAYRKLVSVR